ncbi:MAG: RICIN domain-containing protein, partial [Planctomycetales bacterium]|nr:RICIN domain-containing protein [Planctomycetales bacterium]
VYFNGIGPISTFAALTNPDQGTAIEIDTSAADAPPPLDGFRWKIVNRATGELLDVNNNGTNNGDNIQLWPDNGGLNQYWQIQQQYHKYDGFTPLDGYLALKNVNSGLHAEVANFSLDNGGNVQQWGDDGLLTRHWYIESTGDGYFYVRNGNSNKYLAAASNSSMINVVQSNFDGSTLQQWEFVLANPNPSDGIRFAQDAAGTFPNSAALGNPAYSAGLGDAGMAVVLDGADDYVQLDPGITNSEDITIAAWVKWNGGNSWQRIFDFGNDTNQYMMLTPSSGNGKLRFGITTGGYSQELGLDSDPLTVGQWHHVAITLGGNTGVLYVDGVAVTAGQIPTNPSEFNSTLNYIGKSQFPDPLFNGSISEFAVYDFALSPAQIADLVDASGASLAIDPNVADQVEGDTGSTAFSFTVTRKGNTNIPASADYTVTGSGTNAADAADFGGTFPAGTINFGANETSKTISIDVTADTEIEFDEGFTVTIGNPGPSTWIVRSTANAVIRNDETYFANLHDDILRVGTLMLTTATLTGTSELHITATGDPITGSVVQLNSPDAWLFFDNILPSAVASTLLHRVRVDGSAAVLDNNVQVVQYGTGAVVIPHDPNFAPLEVFADGYFGGASMLLNQYTNYDHNSLGSLNDAISSFTLKRGYMATFAQNPDGSGISVNYVAQDGDLEIPVLSAGLNDSVSFVRVFPWRWTTKKGIAGNIDNDQQLKTQWWYDWNIDQVSSLDREYVAIRQTRWWPDLNQDWNWRGVNHLLGYNEPDHVNQANLAVGDALWSWPDLTWTGLRVGAPAVTDGGLTWLYDFMDQAEAEGKRVDFVPVHYYRSYSNPADPVGAANQFYNFLKGIYDRVQRPLWVTEWNNGANWTGDPDPTFEQQAATVAAMIDMLEAAPFVERYALYNWVEDVRRVEWDDGRPTLAGEVYRDKVSGIAYRQQIPDPLTTPDAVYRFDGDTMDQSGNGHPALQAGAQSFVPGHEGLAIELDGQNDYLQVSPGLGDSTDFTFASWVKWDGGGDWQRIVDLGVDTNNYLFLTPSADDGNLRFAIKNGGSEQRLTHSQPLPTRQWVHVAVTISGDTGKLFVNGQLVATNSSMTINPIDVGTMYNFLGKSQFGADPLFNGALDDVHFFSRALSDSEITTLATELVAITNLQMTNRSSTSISIQWDDQTLEDAYRVERSNDGANWTFLGNTAVNESTWTDNALTEGTEYYYRVQAFNQNGTGAWTVVMGAAPAAVFPSSWTTLDIGAVAGGGAAVNTGVGQWSLVSGGTDIWNNADSFHFTYQTLVGDGEIVAQVTGVENTGTFAKAGVMIRESLAANSIQATVNVTPSDQVQFIRRTATDGASVSTNLAGFATPQWVRLVRQGDTIAAYHGSDGVSWDLVGTETIPMAATVYVGLAAVSWNNTQLNTSTFSDVAVDFDLDFGDAPSSYPTTLANDGARHAPIGPRLGDTRDFESDAQPSAMADGDDMTGGDEDGVMFGLIQTDRTVAGVNIDLQNASNAFIDAWLDFNRDGIWQAGEQILQRAAVQGGLQTLNFDIPVDVAAGETFARVRVSSIGGLEVTGPAADGEVEDYLVNIVNVPSVEGVVIGDGGPGRSTVSELTVTFDREVADPAAAVSIVNRDNNQTLSNLVVSSTVLGGKTVSKITFNPGPSVVTRTGGLNSLADGNYQLRIVASGVTAIDGGVLSSDYDFGDSQADAFFRFFGDSDGDRDVDAQDFGRFGLTFLKANGTSGFNPEFDFDGDGDVDGQDYGRLERNFLRQI